ncbi:YciI family protein [Luteimonas panaciterrae]|uniref:YciI family protein n=1 Tax=Luteimonas panaciterrae TaxID=363885 RepID=UPI001CFBF1B3|nr:YciI family protein [Luteimonas panaciterrae]
MSGTAAPGEYLVISRGKWDAAAEPQQIQQAIDEFYVWIERHVDAGRMKRGQRLAKEAKLVGKQAIIDGPFTEAKEVIGGYWFILANSLEEAAALAAGNPCLEYGLSYEIRPIDPEKASAFVNSSETPD